VREEQSNEAEEEEETMGRRRRLERERRRDRLVGTVMLEQDSRDSDWLLLEVRIILEQTKLKFQVVRVEDGLGWLQRSSTFWRLHVHVSMNPFFLLAPESCSPFSFLISKSSRL